MALPTNLTTVEVTGRFVDQAGAAVRGSVTFDLDTYLLDAAESIVVIDSSVTATLDATGAFAVDLATTNDPDVTPNGWTWTLTPNFDGFAPLTFALPANLGPTVDITVLSPALPNPDPIYSYVLVSAIGAPSGVAPLDSNSLIPNQYIDNITISQIDSGSVVAGLAVLSDGSGNATWAAVDVTAAEQFPAVFMLMGS